MDASKGEIRFAPHGLVGAGSEAPQEPHSLPALQIPYAHKKNTTLTSGNLVEHRGFDSRLTAWSGPALRLHRSLIHSRPFKSPLLTKKYHSDEW